LSVPDPTEQRLGINRKAPLDIGVATTNAQQSAVAMADIVLTLLQRADELCDVAAEQGADMKKVADAFAE
jgi:3-hydroxyisobutyrate dehydrogenase-like beta-hydroxyacid dehydrogenase